MFDFHALGLPGGARGVDDVAQVLRRCASVRAAQPVAGLGGNVPLTFIQREDFASEWTDFTVARRASCSERSWRTDSLFPLTPALSPGEREYQGQSLDISRCVRLAEVLPTILPLPGGEGRGEGECNVRLTAATDFMRLACRHCGAAGRGGKAGRLPYLDRQLARGHQGAGLAIGENKAHSLCGILRVERHVGRAGFQDAEQRDIHVYRARQPKADAIAAPHSPAAEKPRQLVGPALQLAIGHLLLPADQGELVGAGLSLLLEQLVQQLGVQQVRVGRAMEELCDRRCYPISTCGSLSSAATRRTTDSTWPTPSAQ